jgi:hypothetical protein
VVAALAELRAAESRTCCSPTRSEATAERSKACVCNLMLEQEEAMSDAARFANGSRVLVKRKTAPVARGVVMGSELKDGRWRYLVELRSQDGIPYFRAHIDDPNSWFDEDRLSPDPTSEDADW